MLSQDAFSSLALELGFSKVGFCRPERFEYAQRIVTSQLPLAERRQLRFSPEEDYPETKSIAVLLWPYLPARSPADGEVFVDSYYAASNAAYHAARKLESAVLGMGRFIKANVSYPAKTAAIRAGLGVIGRNSLLITPEYGTRVVIILMATDIDAEPDVPQAFAECQDSAECIGCGQCAKACPSGAITPQGMTHPERCLRNFIMEGVVVPEDLREKIGVRLIGCDICQRVCPMQTEIRKRAGEIYRLSDYVTEDAALFSAAVSRLADEIGRNAARPQRVRAQAALLAGNDGNPEYLPVLRKWSQMPFDAVREHALWAISKIERTIPDT